ncbi:hypothetical protein [Mucilaginibacter sp. NFX135]|uniref:hypothetical protein n=1 Tax=Mucilaginibacter sp. NFX135 TaxID=3402687 RepID=UPI003AFB7AF2
MMSPKSLTKTRWIIDANRVIVYPHRVSYILAVVVALVFAGIMVLYITNVHGDTAVSIPFFIFLVIIPVLFFAFGNTYVEFDGSRGTMQKKLFGFIPVKTMPMSALFGINVVTTTGGYNYRLFSKKDRYGKGILVSSGYTKKTDTNAQAFAEQVIPVVHGYLDQYGSVVDSAPQPITSYKYYTHTGGSFTIKKRKTGLIIFGILFLAFGIHELVNPWMKDVSILQKVLVTVVCAGIGLGFMHAAFSSIVFDTGAGVIKRTGPLGWGNKTISFNDFAGFQTIRKSTNSVYTGTEIHLYYRIPDTQQQASMMLQVLKSSEQIERFLEETKSIMNI